MNKKVTGIVIAIVLAAVGTISLVSYVRSAEERAQSGERLVEVYVVSENVPAGTPVSELSELVTVELVPAKVQATNSVQSLKGLEGQVASVELVAGEQLVNTRFIAPADFASRDIGVIIPAGKVEITLQLEPQRAIGGLLQPGDTVAVIASFDATELTASVVEVDGEEVAIPDSVASSVNGQVPSSTGLILHKVLVTAVQQSASRSGVSDGDVERSRLEEAPADDVFITLAVDPADAERLVFSQEFGYVWLAQERSDVPEYETELQTRGSVYDTPDAPGVIEVSR